MEIKFTVGMAVFDYRTREGQFPEYPRVAFTVMNLLTHHPLVGEVVVVDNNPTPHSPLPVFLAKTGRARYVPMPSPVGTSPPRNRVFSEARFVRVVCIDPHVILYPGFLESLAEFYGGHPDAANDLLHGPMMTEAGTVMGDLMNDQWRAEMWGTWGRGWITRAGRYFSVLTRDDRTLEYASLNDGTDEQHLLSRDEVAAYGLPPDLPWPQHENALYKIGCNHPVTPYTIPGHGMGFFACGRDAWLPFHPDARGFGGEEMTTGVRFRRAGRRVWCVPSARWWHHFDRPYSGVPGQEAPYRNVSWDRVRNYVLEFKRLGLDPAPVHRHFVQELKKVPEGDWQQLLAGRNWPDPGPNVNVGTMRARPADMPPDAVPQSPFFGGSTAVPEGALIQHVARPAQAAVLVPDQSWSNPVVRDEPGCAETGQTKSEVNVQALDYLYKTTAALSSNASADMPVLRELASGYGEVVELAVHASATTLALLAAMPKRLTAFHGTDPSPDAARLRSLAPPGTAYDVRPWEGPETSAVPENDLLFINLEPHSGLAVRNDLIRYQARCRRFMAVHGSGVYGWDYNGGPGVLDGVIAFLKMEGEKTPWRVVRLHASPSGLVVLSRSPADGPAVELKPPARQTNAIIPPDRGPGTELKKMLAAMGINPEPACDCNAKALQMDLWGPAGCRANLEMIVDWMREGQWRWGWRDKLKAALGTAPLVVTGAVNPLDPFPGLVAEAVRRAETEAAASAGPK